MALLADILAAVVKFDERARPAHDTIARGVGVPVAVPAVLAVYAPAVHCGLAVRAIGGVGATPAAVGHDIDVEGRGRYGRSRADGSASYAGGNVGRLTIGRSPMIITRGAG